MTERETAAAQAGLKDLALLKLHPDDAPIATVMADLRQRFSGAFGEDVRPMTRSDYLAARAEMLQAAARPVRRELPPVDARGLSRAEYAQARQALLRSVA